MMTAMKRVASGPKPFRYIRRDFYRGKCFFCPKAITSGVAFFVTDGQHEYPAGPNCAKRYAEGEGSSYPDLTRGALVVDDGSPGTDGERSGISSGRRAQNEWQTAVEYVLLRMDKLGDWRWAAHAKLLPALVAIREGTLTTDLVGDVQRIITWARRSAPALAPEHVSAVYACRRTIEHLIEILKPEKRAYLQSRLGELQARGYIPGHYLQGTQNWITPQWKNVRLRTATFAQIEEEDLKKRRTALP